MKYSNLKSLMRGFTILEIIIVIGAAAVLVAISAGVYITFLKRSYVDETSREMQSVLNLARAKTLSSDGFQSFGVHIDSANNEYVLFPGVIYDSMNPENETFKIHPRVTVASIDIAGGGDDVVFDRLNGTALNYGNIELEDASDASNRIGICIYENGVAELRASCIAPLVYDLGTIDADLASFPSNSGSGDPAQSFLAPAADSYARAADLYLRRATSDPSDIFLEIIEPTTVSDAQSNGRSLTISGSSLPINYDWVRFIFPRPVFLEGGLQYFLRLKSLPDSTVAFSGASGTIHWGYEHSATAPPAYADGDAWRYVGQSNVPTYEGEQLGPLDQYDFSFKIIYDTVPPPNMDSRHLDFDLEDSSGFGWTIRGASTTTLIFSDLPNPDVTADIGMSDYFNASSTIFAWEDDIDVNGDIEHIRIHTHYIDDYDTALSIHRDGRFNDKAVSISVDGKDIVSYDAAGTPTVGAYGGIMVRR